MCLACWGRDVDGAPWCEACIALLERPTPWIAYVAGAVLSVGGVFAGVTALGRRFEIGAEPVLGLAGVAALAIGVTTYKLHGRAERARGARTIVPRRAAPPEVQPQSPYRGRLRRLARVIAPPLSGQMTVLVTIMLMALVAGTVPTLLTLPRWVEWELVMGGWWLVWTGIFTVLLFRGWRIADDMPDLRRGGSSSGSGRGLLDGLGELGAPGCVDPEGCVVAILFLLALAVALLLAWVLVELVLPVVIAAAYWLMVRALARVANDHHECEGHFGRAMGWASLWALTYTAPLALVIAIGQVILASR
ncbi:MAG TPA: hypothetical protein ENK57_23780 [Polyangiaceae bacterium]|nr:hypothetical protein [Polyangiaceae bacterium]